MQRLTKAITKVGSKNPKKNVFALRRGKEARLGALSLETVELLQTMTPKDVLLQQQ
jgi:hypothetical protein